jgi:undecaprenyl-diphosphatase
MGEFDEVWIDWMTNLRWTPLIRVSRVLDVIGSGLVLWPVRILVAAWLGWRRRRRALTIWVAAAVVSEAAIGLLKAGYARTRPPDPLVSTSGYSFPSGHAVATAVIVVALVLVCIPPGRARRPWEIAAAGFAVCMAVSRTILGAHWLTDAVAGTVIGLAVTIGAAVVVQWRGTRPPPAAATEGDPATVPTERQARE